MDKAKKKMFEGEVIHFTGGFKEYIGRLEMSDHPLGDGWWRINDPCTIMADEKGDKIQIRVYRLGGINKWYRKYVDFYIPPHESMIEIMTLWKDNDLYNMYIKAINQEPSKHIWTPSDGGAIPSIN